MQAEAIDATRNLLNQSLTLDLGSNVKLVQSCHSEVVFSSIMVRGTSKATAAHYFSFSILQTDT